MIVGADHGCRGLANCGAKDLPGVRKGGGGGPGGHLDPLSKAISPIQAQDPKLLDLQARCGRLQVRGNEVRPVQDRRLSGRQAHGAARDLHGRHQLQRLDPAYAAKAAEVGLVPSEEARKGAGLRYEPCG